MTVVVFCEFGGEKLLGKAREIGDSLGSRVCAVCGDSSRNGEDTGTFSQKIISFGADDVIVYKSPATVFEWADVLSSLVKDEQTKFLIGISGVFTDAIFGCVYAFARERVGLFATGIDSFNENVATKNLRAFGLSFRFGNGTAGDNKKKENEKEGETAASTSIITPNTTTILSFKQGSIPEPFEDTSRYGRIREVNFQSSAQNLKVPPSSSSTSTVDVVQRNQYVDSSSVLTFLLGRSFEETISKSSPSFIESLAKKYGVRVLVHGPQIEDIYGPCFAIDIQTLHERELPRFHGEVIALNSSSATNDHEEEVSAAISKIADVSFVVPDIIPVLKELS